MSGLAGRTILLTGASGVLGHALAARLRTANLVCLTRGRPIAEATESVTGDVTQPRLGLDRQAYQRLTARVDAVVHCAAVTDFRADPDVITATNVTGVGHVLEFAATAGAPLYHMSTAFRDSAERGATGMAGLAYAKSKSAGEEVVRASGLPHVILRPSIVIGDALTGEILRFQSFYYIASAGLAGWLPLVPFGEDWVVDFIPQSTVADIVARLIERDVRRVDDVGPAQRAGESVLWLTAGTTALTVKDVSDEILALAVRNAREEPPRPKYANPDLYLRLIAPVFLPSLPFAMRKTVSLMFDYLSAYLVGSDPYPCDLPWLCRWLDMPDPPDTRVAYARSLDYWAVRSGYASVEAMA
ncbi:MAG TPA: SDR family oxidoreductase [Candidatus Limnocylindrales bacterium]|nr:SDR family oxidoreductase [Candidatus Limnocylindrales bacterium]